jgi:hypothetical protein
VGGHTARRLEWACIALVVAAAAVAYYLATKSPTQPRDAADLLPIADGAQRVDTFVDCSKVNSVAYFRDNPCETFVLVRGRASSSAMALLGSEVATLHRAGWVHPALRPEADYDDVSSAPAPRRDSWVAPDANACAYVATVRAGIRAEGKGFLPFDHDDDPAGLLTFYDVARTFQGGAVLWVRLRPKQMTERGACSRSK